MTSITNKTDHVEKNFRTTEEPIRDGPCLFINDAYIMHANKRKFESNSSLDNYRMTYIEKKNKTKQNKAYKLKRSIIIQ